MRVGGIYYELFMGPVRYRPKAACARVCISEITIDHELLQVDHVTIQNAINNNKKKGFTTLNNEKKRDGCQCQFRRQQKNYTY